MILKSARVRDYKSITDSTEVRVDERVTCLVGKNESGKTAFLEPLYRLNPVASGYPETFEELRDFPRSRFASERAAIATTKPVSATFELEDDDIKAVEEHWGAGVIRSREVVVSRNYANTRAWTLDLDHAAIMRHVVEQAGVDASVAEGCDSVKALAGQLATVEDAAPSVEALRDKIAELDDEQEIQDILAARLPRFLYFDEYAILPGRVSISYLQETDPDDLDTEDRTALSLLRLAGVATQEFSEKEYEARRAALEAASSAITAEVFEFWSQNKNLRVFFDVDFTGDPTPEGEQPPFLEIRIDNMRHHVTLNFDERSRGFVWFFSFLAAFSEYRYTEKLIILLDEPGLGLHAAAQNDLLRYIEERLAPTHQVVYSTHSPFMVEPTKLDRARTVEDVDGEGTKLGEDVLATSADTIFPLQAALGYELLSQTLFVGPQNLVVEGPADYLYLTILSGHLRGHGRAFLDPRWTIVPVGGIDKIPTFVALLGAHLPNIAVLQEVGSRPFQKLENLIERKIIERSKVIPLTRFTGGAEADLEDLFEESFYLALLKASGTGTITKAKLPTGTRIVKRVEEALGGPYDHYRPARHLLENPDPLSKLGTETLDQFEQLFTEVNARLT